MSEITKAIQALCEEKGLAYENVLETVESALAAAYRKDYGNKLQNIKVKFNPETGDMQVWDVKTVVVDVEEEALEKAREELAARREAAQKEGRELTEQETADLPKFNPKTEMMLKDAKAVNKKVKIGEVLEIELPLPGEFGRMAAQTAKQVIIQKLREAERNIVFDDFKGQEGQVVLGVVQRAEGRKVLIDVGKVTAVLPSEEQVGSDHYRPGAKFKFFVLTVQMTSRGPEIILSRRDAGIVRAIFKENIPEIAEGAVEIKNIAREAGWRSKVAVAAKDDSIDPIGSCIGQRGSRINTIIEELGGEKIDVIQHSDDWESYVSHALSPAKVLKVNLNKEAMTAEVLVAADQFSLAIGRGGQNVRLASQLTGLKINVKEEGGDKAASSEDNEKTDAEQKPAEAAEEKEEKRKEEEKTAAEDGQVDENKTQK